MVSVVIAAHNEAAVTGAWMRCSPTCHDLDVTVVANGCATALRPWRARGNCG